MNTAIIASSKDPAGINIRDNLIDLFDFEKINETFDKNNIFQYDRIKNKNIKLYLTNNDLIFSESIDKKIDADILIFASKHRSRENTPSFTVHPIGNWHKADFGGQGQKLCPSSAALLKNLFIELNNAANKSNYELTMEATHHGPYTEKPSIFVEIGSTEKEWNDKENGEIVAKTIINSLKNENKDYESCIVLGGGHYNQSANKLMLRTNYATGHLCPKYALEYLDEEIIWQAINKTIPKPNIILLDWKGLGKEKQRIVEMLKNLNLEYKRTDKILQ